MATSPSPSATLIVNKELRLQKYKPFTTKETLSKSVTLSPTFLESFRKDVKRDPIHTTYRRHMDSLVEYNTKEIATLFKLHPEFHYFQGFNYIYNTLVELLPSHSDAYEVSLYILNNHFQLLSKHEDPTIYLKNIWQRTLSIIKVMHYERYLQIHNSHSNIYFYFNISLYLSWGLDIIESEVGKINSEQIIDFLITTSNDSIAFVAANILMKDDIFFSNSDLNEKYSLSTNLLDEYIAHFFRDSSNNIFSGINSDSCWMVTELKGKFKVHLCSKDDSLITSSSKLFIDYNAIMQKRLEFNIFFGFGFVFVLIIGIFISKFINMNKRNRALELF